MEASSFHRHAGFPAHADGAFSGAERLSGFKPSPENIRAVWR
jgi:hypothetical protein